MGHGRLGGERGPRTREEECRGTECESESENGAFGCTTESTHWKLAVLAAGASVAARTSVGKPSTSLRRPCTRHRRRDRKGARDPRTPSILHSVFIFFLFFPFSNSPRSERS